MMNPFDCRCGHPADQHDHNNNCDQCTCRTYRADHRNAGDQ